MSYSGEQMQYRRLRDLLNDQSGATLVEYGMLAMMIALLCIVALKLIGPKIAAGYQQANTLLP